MILKQYFKLYGLKISYRNGLYDGQIVWGISDIDINIIVELKLNKEISSKIQKIYRRAKKIIPVLGEYNLILITNYEEFLPFANSFALRRDPFFLDELTIGSESQKVIFLTKLLEANSEHLKLFSGHSQNKWIGYFCKVSVNVDSITDRKSVIEEILKSFPKYVDKCSSDHLLDFLPSNDYEINYYYKVTADRSPMMSLSTMKWLGASILYNTFGNDIQKISSDKFKLELFLTNVDWEIWGIYTQIIEHNPAQLIKHLENIIKVLNQFSEVNIDIGPKRVPALRSLIEQAKLLI